ncbi:DUF4123 domain-containing protein [Atlantibacter subterraneus]|uniref:DUF4123 domain-containing protein n=1 Tax=Atlantibacter subterraneus TaxID=255519 RepID=UPI0029654ECE|nr:DUF4123 domain-containing protein [Atlantibacter subterranea]MDW2741683.1 DUF4123 domain-containing protein [Atlantibacter subterranea]
MDAVRYAIVDGAIEEGLLEFLEKINPPHCCLYAQPVQPDLVPLAPYLVEVTPEVETWLQTKESPWGIYLIAEKNMNNLRQHLRKYLQVLIPDESKPVLFRFYDPRNIWDFLSVLSEWEKIWFIGPIDKFITYSNGSYKEENFSMLKQKYPQDSGTRRKMMKISHSQMDDLATIYEQRYVDSLVKNIASWGENSENIDRQVITDTLHWLKEQNITDDRSIRGLFYLFQEKRCLSVDAIPLKFKEILCIDNEVGVFKAETHILKELGRIPL